MRICRKCNVSMIPGKAISQTWTAGVPDFIGDTNPTLQTMSPGGPGKLIDCLKCPCCGYSVTMGECPQDEDAEMKGCLVLVPKVNP